MSTRAVLVAAVITGLILGIAGARAEHSALPRKPEPVADRSR
ncbi:hypothetical protein [Streptomyces apocyni]|nr:hypothetical protein [Streptomyces apocyni]